MRKEVFLGGATLAASSVLWYFWKRKAAATPLQAPIQAEIDPMLRIVKEYVPPLPPLSPPRPSAPMPRILRTPYNEPHFGSDKERNADEEIRLDDYLNLPLEGSGKTHATKDRYVDLDEEVATAVPQLEHFTFFRLKVLKTRAGTAPTVAIGGFKLLLGKDIVYHPKAQVWNPHTGERATFYPEVAWSDSDQKELIVKFPFPVSVDSYKIRTSEQDIAFDPIEWRLEGSLNGVYWLPLDEREVECPTVRGVWMGFDCV